MADSPVPANANLLVDRAALQAALKFLKRYIRPKKPGQACLVFDDGVLVIQAGPVSARAQAEGSWPGTAWCSALVVLGLLEGLPTTEHILMQVDGDRLRIANYTFACRWETLRDLPFALPLAVTTSYILSLRLHYTEAEITRAGLTAELITAEKTRDKAFAAAAKALAPLEISKVDLMEYYEARLRQQYVDPGRTPQDSDAKQPLSGLPTAKLSTSG